MQTISELERTLQFVKKKDKVDTLIKLAELCLSEDLQSASSHAKTARKLARKLKLKEEQAIACRLIARTLFLTGRFRPALDMLGESLSLTRETNDLKGQSRTLLDLGKNYYKINDFDKSVESYFAALDLAQEEKDNFLQAEIMYNVALINIITDEYDQAKKNLLNVIKIWKYQNNETGIFNALLNLGIIAFHQDKTDEARSQTFKALELAEKIGKENFLAEANNSLAKFLIEENRFENALDLLLEFADILEENDQAVWVYGEILNNVAICYLRISDLEQAKEYAQQSLKIARVIDSKLLIVKNLEIISELALEEEDYKLAYESTNELHELKQLIHEKETAAKLAEIKLRSGITLQPSRSAIKTEKRMLTEAAQEKKIKDILQENDQFQLIVESSEDIITLHDSKGKYLYCNRPFLYSIKAEDLIGKSPYNFYKFEYGDALVRQIKYTYSSGKSNHLDSVMEVEDQERWFTNYIYPVTDHSGNIVAVAMLSQSKAEGSSSEAEQVPQLDEGLIKQLESLSKEKLIWESFREEVRKFVTFRVELDDDAPIKQKVIYFSSSVKDILGINLADDFAKWFQHIHQDEKEKFISDFQYTVQQGRSFQGEIKIFHPERDEYRWVELLLDPVFSKNKVQYLNGIITDITQRKKEEKKLISKLDLARLHKELLLISSQAYVLTGMDGTIIDYNRALPEMTGYSNKAIADLNWFNDFTEEDFLPLENKIIETMKSAGKHQVYEKIIPTSTNQKIETEISLHAILNDEGKIHRYCFFINDISNRNQLIAQLRASNQEMNALLQSLPEVLLEIDENGLIVNLIPNQLAEKLGLQKGLKGSNLDQVFPENVISGLRSSIQSFLETETPVEFEFKFNDLMLRVEISRSRENTLMLLISDISSSKETELDLQKSRKKYLDIFHASPQPLCLLDPELKLDIFNSAFADLSGFSQEELQALELKDLLTDQEMITQIADKLSQKQAPAHLETELKTKNKAALPVSMSFEIIDEQGQLLISWQDISRHLEQINSLQQQFQAKEKDYQNKLSETESELDKLKQKLQSESAEHQVSLTQFEKELAEKEQNYQAKITEIKSEIQGLNDQHQKELDELKQQLKSKEIEYQTELSELQAELDGKDEEHQNDLSRVDQVLLEKEQHHQDKIKAIEADHQEKLSKIDELLLEKETEYEEKIEELLEDIRVKENEHQEKLDLLNSKLNDKEAEQVVIINELNEQFSEKEKHYQSKIEAINQEIKSKEAQYLEEIDKLNKELKEKEKQKQSRSADSDEEFRKKERDLQEKIQNLEKEISELKQLRIEPNHYSSFQLVVENDRENPLQVVYCSPSLKKLCGIKATEDFTNWFQYVLKDDRTELEQAWKKLLNSAKSLDHSFRIQLPDNSEFTWLRLIADPELHKNKLHIVNGIIFDVTHTKLIESELENKLQEIKVSSVVLQEFNQAFAVCDAEGLFLQVNNAFCQLTGYKSKDLIYKLNWDKLRADEDSTKFKEISFTAGNSHIEESTLQPKKGDPLPVKLILHPYFDKQGDLKEIYCFAIDLSSFQVALSELQESGQGLQSLFQALPQDILLLDKNAALSEILNLSEVNDLPLKQTDTGKKIQSLFPAEATDAIKKGLQECLKLQSSLEIEFSLDKDPQKQWLRGKFRYKSADQVYLITTDITALHQLKENIRELQNRFTHIYNNTPVAMLTLDPEFNFIEINKAAEKLIGFSNEEVQQMNLKDLETKKHELLTNYHQVLEGKSITALEQHLEKENETTITFLNHTFPMSNEQGELKLILSFWIDITEQKELEAELDQTRQDLKKAADHKVAELKAELVQMNALLNAYENMAFFSLTADKNESGNYEVTFSSPSIKKLLQLKVMGNLNNWVTNFNPDAKEKFFDMIENCRAQLNSASATFQIKDSWLRLDLKATSKSQDQVDIYGIFRDITSSQETQTELAESLEESTGYASLLQNSPVAFLESNRKHKILRTNAAFCQLTGYQETELQEADDWIKLLAGKQFREMHAEKFQQVLEEQQSKLIETTFTNRNGDSLQVELTVFKVSSEADDKYLIIAHDITDRAALIEQLQKAEAELQKVISYLPYDLLELDHNGKVINVINTGAQDIFLQKVEPEASLHSIYPGKTADKILSALQKCLKDRTNEEFRFTIEADDQKLWYKAALICKDENSLIFIPEEITSSIKLEDQYQEILQKYKSSIAECPVPFLTLNQDLQIQYLNEAAIKLLDLSSDKAEGRSINEFDPGKNKLSDKLANVLQGKNLINFELEINDSQANPITVLSYAYPVTDESGKVPSINIMWVDISDRKLLEKDLKLKKASLEKSTDENVKELTEKLAGYEAFIQEDSRFGLFRAELIAKKTVLSFSNKVLFKLLGSANTTDLQELFSKLPKELLEKISKLLTHNENEQQEIDETVALDLEKQRWIRLCLNFPVKEKKSNRLLQGIVFDVTDQMLKEIELNETLASMNRVEEILYDSDQAFVVISQKGKLLNYNPAFKKLTAYSTDQLQQLKWLDTVNTADAVEQESGYLKKLSKPNSSITYQREFKCKNNKLIEVEIKAHSLGEEGSDLYLFLNDLTKLKELNKRLEVELTNMKLLLDKFPALIIQLDAADKISQIVPDPQFGLFEIKADSIGEDFQEHIPSTIVTKLVKVVNNFREDQQKNRIELPFEKEKQQNWLEIELAHLENENILLICRDITSRKAAEIDLQKTSANFKSLFENTPLPVITLDADFKFTSANLQAQELLGYDLEELLKLDFKDIELYDHDSPSAVEKLQNGNDLINLEQKLKGKDGRQLTILHNAYVLKDKKGQITSIESALINITERKKREEKLQQQLVGSEAELKEKFKDLNKIINNYDAFFKAAESYAVFQFSMNSVKLDEQKIELSTPSLCRLVDNYEIKVFKDLLKNVVEADRNKIETACQTAITDRKSFSEIFRVKTTESDQLKWLSLSFDPVQDKQGKYSANGFVSDVTELKSAQIRLHEDEQQLKAMISALPLAFYTSTIDGNFTYMSSTFKQLFKLTEDQQKTTWSALISAAPENELERSKAVETLSQGKPAQNYRLELIDAKGRKFLAEIKEAPVIRNDETISVVGVLQDLSKQEQLESELKLIRNAALACELAMIITDFELEIIFASRTSADLFGLNDNQDIIGRDLSELLHLEDRVKFKKQLHQDLFKVSKWQDELELLQKDKTIIRKKVTFKTFKGWQDKDFLAVSFKDIVDMSDLQDQIEFFREELETQKSKEISLREGQKMLEDAIDIAGIGLWNWDLNKNEIQCSEGFFKILGLEKPKKVIDLELFKQLLHPQQETELNDFLKSAASSNEKKDLKLTVLDPQDKPKYLELHTITYFDKKKPHNLLGVVYQLAEIITTPDLAAQPDKEVSSAVKRVEASNAMLDLHQQVITHLIDEKPDFSLKEKNELALKAIQERAEIISLIMKQAMTSKTPDIIIFQSFLQNLLQNMGRKLGTKKLISMRINAKQIRLPLTQAIPCGLIVYELVNNSINFAFPDDRKTFYENTIKIDMIKDDNGYRLSVSDNGIGMQENFDLETQTSTGLKLVKLWAVQQLNGKFSLDPEHQPGVKFYITF